MLVQQVGLLVYTVCVMPTGVTSHSRSRTNNAPSCFRDASRDLRVLSENALYDNVVPQPRC